MEVITAIIAGLIAIITLGHFLNNRARLRHDLFGKRFEQFKIIAGFLSDIVRSGDVTDQEVKVFLQETRSAYYVFGCNDKIRALIYEIHSNAESYYALKRTGEKSGEESRLSGWFSNTLRDIDDPTSVFTKYLMLDINIWYSVVWTTFVNISKLLKKLCHGRGREKDRDRKPLGRSRKNYDSG